MKEKIISDINNDLLKKYLNNSMEYFLSDNWTPLEVNSFTEAIYSVLVQKIVTQLFLDESSRNGDNWTHDNATKTMQEVLKVENLLHSRLSSKNLKTCMILEDKLKKEIGTNCLGFCSLDELPNLIEDIEQSGYRVEYYDGFPEALKSKVV